LSGVSTVHLVTGYVVLAANGVAGIWGVVAWLRREPSAVFWYLLRAAQAIVVAQVALGLLLLAQGLRPPDELHYVYGGGPLLVTLVSEGMRMGAAQRELAGVADLDALDRDQQADVGRRVLRREMGIMAVGCLVIVSLALRAVFTGVA
jgi:hypothetical protein